MSQPDAVGLPLTGCRAPVAVLDLDLDAPAVGPDGLALTTLVLARRSGRPVSVFVAPAGSTAGTLLELAAAAGQADTAEPLAEVPTPPTAAVVVTTVRVSDELAETVDDVLAQSLPADEILVVDNRPETSGVGAWLRERYPDGRVVHVPEHRPGLGRARNAGLRATSAQIVAFTDDDVRLDRRWLERLARAFVPEVDCVTGLLMPADLGTEAQLLMEQFGGFSKGLVPRYFDLAEHPLDDPLFPFCVGRYGSGANAAFRTDVLRRLGGFDPALGTGRVTRGGEDLDIFLRVVLAGRRLAYQPAAIVWHNHEAEMDQFRQRAFGYGVGLGAVLGKHVLGSGRTRREMLRRVPQAVNHLTDPKSSKNVQKSSSYPRGYTWLERLGILVGPAMYLAARWAGEEAATPVRPDLGPGPGSASGSGSGEESGPWPIWCTECDVAEPRWSSLRAPVDGRYRTGRVLVRLHGEPLGYVQLPLVDGAVTRGAILAAAGDDLVARAREHLRAEGVPDSRDWPDLAGVEVGAACPNRVVPSPTVTVALCTRNAGPRLTRCLEFLKRLTYPGVDVLIVDNAPVDDSTKSVFNAVVGDDQRFRYVVEAMPGLSRARNRALVEARGEILAFTDDDVDVDPGWIEGLVRGFARGSQVGCVTGLVCTAGVHGAAEAYFDGRVSWGDSCVPRTFSLARDGADPLFPYSPGIFGTGANFALRTGLLRELGGFDDALGAGTLTGGGEDLDAFVEVVLAGKELVYEPAAVVWHHHRADLDQLGRQMFGYGSGFTAFLTKHLLDRRTRIGVLRRLVIGVARLVKVPSRTAETFEELPVRPRALLARELLGLASGPVLYLRARTAARRQGVSGHLRGVSG